jgi:chromosomal replication initiation ATPase DnaA
MTEIEKAQSVRRNVCLIFDVTEAQLDGKNKAVKIVWPRQIAMALIQKHCQLTHEKIGDMFGGKSAGAVTHACARYRDLISIDPQTKELIKSIEEFLFSETVTP